jgi:hypothetical protein
MAENKLSEQLLGAVEETVVSFVTGVQRLTRNLTESGNGYSTVRLETGTRLGARNSGAPWTVSLQEKLMGTFEELETPEAVRDALFMISELPGSQIVFEVAREWETDPKTGRSTHTGEIVRGRDGKKRHEVRLAKLAAGIDPTDESAVPAPKPAKVDPSKVEAKKLDI